MDLGNGSLLHLQLHDHETMRTLQASPLKHFICC